MRRLAVRCNIIEDNIFTIVLWCHFWQAIDLFETNKVHLNTSMFSSDFIRSPQQTHNKPARNPQKTHRKPTTNPQKRRERSLKLPPLIWIPLTQQPRTAAMLCVPGIGGAAAMVATSTALALRCVRNPREEFQNVTSPFAEDVAFILLIAFLTLSSSPCHSKLWYTTYDTHTAREHTQI